MRPLTSCTCANAALPMTRLAISRPARATVRPSASSASPVQRSASAYSACRSPAWSTRRKSFGNAMPCPRSAASLARRSAIRWFSSPSVMSGPRSWERRKPRSRIHPLRARFQPGLQAGLDELVEVAVEHVLRVGALDPGAQVLDPRLVEHVVADLAAPADVGLGGLQRVLLGVALLYFQLVQLGRKHLHRAVAVGVLAALGLAGD